MSLHAAAQHLAAHGRNGDTQLVHMTPGEVKSLQDLARAHGGSLTTNPHTGLPEAGFLSSILPMAAGFALGPAGFGLSAGTAGLLAGGLGYAMTGSLTKGLMAGLGAYGGAGLGEGLSNIGATSEAGATTANSATAQAASEDARIKAIQDDYIQRRQQEILSKELANQSLTPQQIESYVGKTIQPATPAQIQEAAWQAGNNAYGVVDKTPTLGKAWAGLQDLATNPTADKLKMLGGDQGWTGVAKYGLSAFADPISKPVMQRPGLQPLQTTAQPYVPTFNTFNMNPVQNPEPSYLGSDVRYFQPTYGYDPNLDRRARGYAEGGPALGPVERMSIANSIGQNTGYPQANINRGAYATPWQSPISRNMLEGAADTGVNPISGEMNFASGGLSDLGSYSDGGRLLRGPGDGVSDSIPAVIGKKQPARLADGEFVVPARIVSEIGNGSTEAGARKLYAMMDRVQKVRGKTVGKGKVAKDTRADKYLPA